MRCQPSKMHQGGADQLLVKDKDNEVKHRSRGYFGKLFNGEDESSNIELDDSFEDTSKCFVRQIQKS